MPYVCFDTQLHWCLACLRPLRRVCHLILQVAHFLNADIQSLTNVLVDGLASVDASAREQLLQSLSPLDTARTVRQVCIPLPFRPWPLDHVFTYAMIAARSALHSLLHARHCAEATDRFVPTTRAAAHHSAADTRPCHPVHFTTNDNDGCLRRSWPRGTWCWPSGRWRTRTRWHACCRTASSVRRNGTPGRWSMNRHVRLVETWSNGMDTELAFGHTMRKTATHASVCM